LNNRSTATEPPPKAKNTNPSRPTATAYSMPPVSVPSAASTAGYLYQLR
jgi:hypothetical protein